MTNTANLRDLIAATGRIILLKLDSNRQFFCPCDLEIWWMTPKIDRAPLPCNFRLFASFHSHWWIQTGVTVWKRLICVKIDNFVSRVALQFDGWLCKTIGHLFYATSSFVHRFVAIGEFKLELQSGNAQFGSNSTIFLAVWPWNLTDASFDYHLWIQIGVTIRKRLSWVVTSVTLTFDLWPWPFAWPSFLSSVIIPENFMMIRWCEHSGVTDRLTDRQTDWAIHKAAWSQLKITKPLWYFIWYTLFPRCVCMSFLININRRFAYRTPEYDPRVYPLLLRREDVLNVSLYVQVANI